MMLMLFIVGCSFGELKTSTPSQITVVEKDYKDAWIVAYDPNNSTKVDAIKMMIKEPMVCQRICHAAKKLDMVRMIRFKELTNNRMYGSEVRN